MFARVEAGLRPQFNDPNAQGLLKRLRFAHPEVFKKVRWARFLDVYWMDLPISREEAIHGVSSVFWDRVMQWLFTGNLIPSAAGKTGGLFDLMEQAPHRPGKFWAIERRFRPGVTDNVGKTAFEAFEIVLKRKFDVAEVAARVSSGAMIVLEGPELTEDDLALFARDVFCNELIETWTIYPESELPHSDRFRSERIKQEIPKVTIRNGVSTSSQVSTYVLDRLSDKELEQLSQKNLWALSLAEMQAIRDHFTQPSVLAQRQSLGLPKDPTDVEIEVLAQTWSEHCKHKIFAADIEYLDTSSQQLDIPALVQGLFKSTIAGTTAQLQKPWLLSVFDDNAGVVALDEHDALCIKVETHNSPSALDPYGGALTGIVGVNRDILGCGLGAKPIFNTNVFCVANPDYSDPIPDRLMHPRRILDGIRRGVEHGGNKSGIPTLNGALVFDKRYLGKPLVYCGTAGIIPRQVAEVGGVGTRSSVLKEIHAQDRICMVGGRIGKDGIHGATFSSLALDASSPSSAVQLGDPLTQKRMIDFILEARDLGLFRAITDNGAGGLSSSVGELARLSGGASMDVGLALTKYPGLKPYELTVSESQERMTVAVPREQLEAFKKLALVRGVEVCDLGEFNSSGSFDVLYHGKSVASLNLEFLHKGVPKLKLKAEWKGMNAAVVAQSAQVVSIDRAQASFFRDGLERTLELLGRLNIASKEWLIRQYDHEVQGTSVIKPLHLVGLKESGPNDGGVIKPKSDSFVGIAVGCGINPKLSDFDPYLMAQSVVDEAVRNVLAVGGEFGKEDSVLALVDNFCWPDPVHDVDVAGALVRTCYGLREAALALGAPLVSGKDSMKNNFKGTLQGQPVHIAVPPTLLMTAVARVPDIRAARSSDFKFVGDRLFILGPGRFGLQGSEYQSMMIEKGKVDEVSQMELGLPDWSAAKQTYLWLGGAMGQLQGRLRSVHDISDGGLLTAVAESSIARGFGARLEFPTDIDPWVFGLGEGFHSFVVSVANEDADALESEWMRLEVPYSKVGVVTTEERIEVRHAHSGSVTSWFVAVKDLRKAWKKEGYWE